MRSHNVVLVAIAAACGLASNLAFCQHPPVNATNYGVGDNVFPTLTLWGGVDNVKAHFYTSSNGTKADNAYFYNTTVCPSGPCPTDLSALNGVAHTDNQYEVRGGWIYGEAASTTPSGSGTWGGKATGTAWGSSAAVHGIEVNGLNLGNGAPKVDGVFVVMGGSAKTRAAVSVATSIGAPNGRPDYGIMLAGPHTTYSSYNPASVTGLFIDNVVSGEAIKIQKDQRIALTNSQTTYFRYNSALDKVQLVKNNVVVAQW
jgi:hypothetical protein